MLPPTDSLPLPFFFLQEALFGILSHLKLNGRRGVLMGRESNKLVMLILFGYILVASFTVFTAYFPPHILAKANMNSAGFAPTLDCWCNPRPVIENITHSPLLPDYVDSVVVSADVFDATLDEVLLHYRVDMGEWEHLVMMLQTGNLHQATIPAQPYDSLVEYCITAKDTYGLCTLALNESTYFVYSVGDSLAPLITQVTQSPSPVTTLELVEVSAQITDDGSGVNTVEVYYRVDGGAWSSFSMALGEDSTYTATLPPQLWDTQVDFYIVASDHQGNIAIDDNAGVYFQYTVIDTTPPSIEIIDPNSAQTVSGIVMILISTSDAESGIAFVELYLDNTLLVNTTIDPFSYLWNTTQTENGLHTLQAIAYDHAGNTYQDTTTVNVDNTIPPPSTPDVFLITIFGTTLVLGGALAVCLILRQRGWTLDFSRLFPGLSQQLGW